MNLITEQDKTHTKIQKVFSCFYLPSGVKNNYRKLKIYESYKYKEEICIGKLTVSLWAKVFACQEKRPSMVNSLLTSNY
jgi:hypothetical protein